jgi:hypothetical protein
MIETKRLSPEVLEFRIPYKHGETFEFFLASDIHLDNPKCDRKLFARHLDEAKAKNAPAFFLETFSASCRDPRIVEQTREVFALAT